MIKLTQVASDVETRKYAVIISGGPGLSSLTLRSLDLLKRSMNLVYVDFHGTNDVPYNEDASLEKLSVAAEKELRHSLPLDSDIFLIAHSFGGFFASILADLLPVKGIFCLSVPFSLGSLESVVENYARKATPSLKNAEAEWVKNRNDETFKKWLSEYGELYFINPKGRDLLLNDKSSARFFLANRSDASDKEYLLDNLAQKKILKVFISGKLDSLISEKALEKDALRGGFQFLTVENASHFLTFDQPEKVASLIEQNIATVKLRGNL